MPGGGDLVSRDDEITFLRESLAALEAGRGGVVLASGEAGVGKTVLIESALAGQERRVLRGRCYPGAATPFEPLVTMLRDHQAAGIAGRVTDLADEDPREALRQKLDQAIQGPPTVVWLDDLHWADAATLELLERWAPSLVQRPVLFIGAYRSEGLRRHHPLRRLRAQLRRTARARELALAPLDLDGTTALLSKLLGEPAPAGLSLAIHQRAHGLPFYVEALAGPDAVATAVPERISDAVLLRLESLSPDAVELAEIVAAAGGRLPIQVASELCGDTAVEELGESGLFEEPGEPEVGFRHALMRDALYAATAWTRRRSHHRRLAATFEAAERTPESIAAQWLAAGEPLRARPWLVRAAQAACSIHAYRDAHESIHTALRSWPSHEDTDMRLKALELWARCAERCGEYDDAVAALQQIAQRHEPAADHAAVGQAERRLAAVHELRGDWTAALAARSSAVAAFDAAGRLRESAIERLAMAAHLLDTWQLSDALRLVTAASRDLTPDDVPLRARALGLEGAARATLGEADRGVALAREGLDLVLSAGFDEVSGEIYYLWADALEHASRYPDAVDAWSAAFDFCQAKGLDSAAHLCLACLAPSLRRTGRWREALEVCREVMAQPAAPHPARMVAAGELGLILACRGETKSARRHLAGAYAFAEANGAFGLEIDTTWGLAQVAEAEGDPATAAQRLSRLVRRCANAEERHFAVAALRWAASFFARHGLAEEVAACTDVLAGIAAATGAPEALAALACAHGESALLDGDARRAADGFERALGLLAPLGLPPELAEVGLRCGVALGLAGAREEAVDRLVTAYRTARNLAARPLARDAATELASLGEDVAKRLGRRAAREVRNERLSRRELEILRHVARGLTNREIAQELFLSIRTVDMHVRHLLSKLDSRGRAGAVSRAVELGLLANSPAPRR